MILLCLIKISALSALLCGLFTSAGFLDSALFGLEMLRLSMSLKIQDQIREEFILTVSNEAESCLNRASAYYGNF